MRCRARCGPATFSPSLPARSEQGFDSRSSRPASPSLDLAGGAMTIVSDGLRYVCRKATVGVSARILAVKMQKPADHPNGGRGSGGFRAERLTRRQSAAGSQQRNRRGPSVPPRPSSPVCPRRSSCICCLNPGRGRGWRDRGHSLPASCRPAGLQATSRLVRVPNSRVR